MREVRRWVREVDAAAGRIGPRFRRPELRGRAVQYLRGLIGRVERKNGWQLAEEVGESKLTNLQHFVARARWDADKVRDDLRDYAVERLVDRAKADASVLIVDETGFLKVDETGFLKKGTKSVGVKRMYSGTAGRIENCQIGVFLALRTLRGHALIDRALYLPQEWADDADRRRAAKVPEAVQFSTKPALAAAMLERALDAGVPCGWVTADEAYGGDYRFRRMLEDRGVGFVVAVSKSQRLWAPGFRQLKVEEYVREFAGDPADWEELSCGAGTKGERRYRWAALRHGAPLERDDGADFRWTLLVRESLNESEAGVPDRAYYLTCSPKGTPLRKLAEVAGSRWAIEECFEQAKQETGLDDYEVRSWAGWRRHVTLSMLAHTTLAAIRARAADAAAAPKKRARSGKTRAT
ncbi:IS701 family transposase [Alienimonas sp. DA493]|uniref:IS701 family transposase n=1 Tax=Alienimonas sp. DA493 TaxID=3373605 RepID=UPI0037550563